MINHRLARAYQLREVYRAKHSYSPRLDRRIESLEATSEWTILTSRGPDEPSKDSPTETLLREHSAKASARRKGSNRIAEASAEVSPHSPESGKDRKTMERKIRFSIVKLEHGDWKATPLDGALPHPNIPTQVFPTRKQAREYAMSVRKRENVNSTA